MNKLAFFLFLPFILSLIHCSPAEPKVPIASIEELGLKRGEVITCGSGARELGAVDFELSCNPKVREDFNLAMELLHSFEYAEAEKVFAKIIDQSPTCAMAYWGVAMSSFHPLWEPPTEADLKRGAKAIEITNILEKSPREEAFIHAIRSYYQDYENVDAPTRLKRFEKAMDELHQVYPNDIEASIFYSLSLVAAADPTDKTFKNQKKAGEILEALQKEYPNHPGIVHYIIHTFDYPGLAPLGLSAARKYAQVAPSSSHALHMPSHIFTRLGLWDDCISSNSAAKEAAICYAETAGMPGHWDEELHAIDYLVYAYLQKGDTVAARQLSQYLSSMPSIQPMNFKVGYAFAAVPARIALENKNWKEASSIVPNPKIPWEKFPWQESIIHFTRLLGAVHTNHISDAEAELNTLQTLHAKLTDQKLVYHANQVAIQIKSGQAWIAYKKGKSKEALQLMREAAAMEDATSKHPVTPGEVLPARELLGDMLVYMKDYTNALKEYKSVLEKSPNRKNSLKGVEMTSMLL